MVLSPLFTKSLGLDMASAAPSRKRSRPGAVAPVSSTLNEENTVDATGGDNEVSSNSTLTILRKNSIFKVNEELEVTTDTNESTWKWAEPTQSRYAGFHPNDATNRHKGAIQFEVLYENPTHWTDAQVFVEMITRVTRANGTSYVPQLPAGHANVGNVNDNWDISYHQRPIPLSNFAHNMWENVDIYVGEKKTTRVKGAQRGHYYWHALFENLLSKQKWDNVNSLFQECGFFTGERDTLNAHTTFAIFNPFAQIPNNTNNVSSAYKRLQIKI